MLVSSSGTSREAPVRASRLTILFILLCGFVTLPGQDASTGSEVSEAALQNPILREHYYEEYWAGRRPVPLDPNFLSRTPNLPRRLLDASVDKQILKLVQDVEQRFSAMRTLFLESAADLDVLQVQGPEPSDLKSLKEHLEKLAGEARELHRMLFFIFPQLNTEDDFRFRPGAGAKLDILAAGMELLGDELIVAGRRIRETLVGTTVVSVNEIKVNVLTALGRVRRTAEALAREI